MDEKNPLRTGLFIILLFLLLFVPLNSEMVYGTCTPKTSEEMWTYLVDVPNYSKIDILALERIDPGTYYGYIYQATYARPYRSVEIKVINYDSEETAAADVMVFPSSIDLESWNVTTFRGHPAYERMTETISSEYIDRKFDLRVVNGCVVVRGLWREKVRRYDQFVTLEDGKASAELVVGAIIDELDGRTGPYIEAPPVNETLPRPSVVVVSNSIDRTMASDFFTFLDSNGIDVVHSTAMEFDNYMGESVIVILGGPDAPEGVGGIVQGLLTMVEGNSIREEGALKKFTKENVWAWGQKVTILAGSGREQTQMAHETYREDILQMVR